MLAPDVCGGNPIQAITSDFLSKLPFAGHVLVAPTHKSKGIFSELLRIHEGRELHLKLIEAMLRDGGARNIVGHGRVGSQSDGANDALVDVPKGVHKARVELVVASVANRDKVSRPQLQG